MIHAICFALPSKLKDTIYNNMKLKKTVHTTKTTTVSECRRRYVAITGSKLILKKFKMAK